jgi:hypothetical protein
LDGRSGTGEVENAIDRNIEWNRDVPFEDFEVTQGPKISDVFA